MRSITLPIAAFEVMGEPVSKSRARFTKRGSKTFAYTPEKTKDGERAIAAAYLKASRGRRVGNAEVAYRVEAHFYNGTRQRRDVDNMLKLILDGLNGVAWVDDNQVTQVEARKSYVLKSEARTEVKIFTVGMLEPPKDPCIRCGKEFRTYESWRSQPSGKKFCSSECGYAYKVEQRKRTCATCSDEFLAWGPTKETRFCSVECKTEAGRADFTCAVCENPFRDQKNLTRRKHVFCSETCREAFHVKRNRACPKGHLWAEYGKQRKNGIRYCGECSRISARAWHGRKKTKGSTELDPATPFAPHPTLQEKS